MPQPNSFKTPFLSATAFAVFCALGINATVPPKITGAESVAHYLHNANDESSKVKAPSKPISYAALRKAVKVAAESSTVKLRRELMDLIGEQVAQYGIDFSPTETEQTELRTLGASDELVNLIARKGLERAVWLEQQEWAEVQAAGLASSFHAYLQKYPSGQYVSAARAMLEDLQWKAVQKEESEQSLTQYLSAYPQGKYAQAAQSRLEFYAWQTAQAGGKADDFTRFLDAYPQGQFSASAQNRLAQLAWEKIKQSRDIGRFQKFVEQYPQGTLADAARIRIEQLRWESVLAAGKQSDFEDYLKQYPQGHFAGSARTRIEHIKDPGKASEKIEEVTPFKLADEEIRQYLINEILPALPSESARKRPVKVRVVLSVMGTVQMVEAVSGSKAGRLAALEAVNRWSFRPVAREGKAVVAEGVITIRFADSGNKSVEQ